MNFLKMKSKPAFLVDIKKGNKTLSFWCSYLPNDTELNAKDGPVCKLNI